MSKFLSHRYPRTLFAAGALILAGSAPTALATPVPLLEPLTLITDTPVADARTAAQILAARRYASFWSTGDAALAQAALAPDFTDRTLPAGRAQGTQGPLLASATMRKAIPDLHCEIEQMIVAGDRVVVHLHFRGHFSGVLQNGAPQDSRPKQTQGHGQAIDFIATDIYRIKDGRIADNWHIEDNLTLFQQLGLVAQ